MAWGFRDSRARFGPIWFLEPLGPMSGETARSCRDIKGLGWDWCLGFRVRGFGF